MRSTILYPFIACLLALCMTGCKKNYTPATVQTLDSVLTSGRIEYYGAYYKKEGVLYDVVCLDLYSKGLWLNKDGVMEGTGTNLYIGDIFVSTATPKAEKASDYLPEDKYESDSVAELLHFLRGVEYDGNYGGSYVLLKNESGYKVLPLTKGEMSVAYIGDTLVLDGSATLKGQQQTYPFHYRDVLPVIDRAR